MTDTWDEAAARRGKFAQIQTAQQADAAQQARLAQILPIRAARRPQAAAIVKEFIAGGDLDAFRAALQPWATQKADHSFNGIAGMGFLTSLINQTADLDALADLLRSVLAVPNDRQAASEAIARLAEHAASVKRGPQPAPRNASFFCSFLWQQQDESVPCAWTSAVESCKALRWVDEWLEPGAEYLAYATVVDSLGVAPIDAEATFAWFAEHRWVGLDPSLIDRVRRAFLVARRRRDGQYASAADAAEAELHTKELVAEMSLLGPVLDERVSDAFGRTTTFAKPNPRWDTGFWRADTWAQWIARRQGTRKNEPVGAFVVWATPNGVFAGLQPSYAVAGWARQDAERILGLGLPGVALYRASNDGDRLALEPTTTPIGAWVFGRWYHDTAALDRADLVDELVTLAAELQPALDAMFERVDSSISSVPSEPTTEVVDDDRLAGLVERFKTQTGYPTPADNAQEAARQAFAAVLTREQLEIGDVPSLRKVFSSSRYGSPGPQAILNATLRDADPAMLASIFSKIARLLHGEEPVEERIDTLLDPANAVRGLGEAVMMKLLAVVHPDRFIPVYPYQGPSGKARMLQALGIPPLPSGTSRGELQVRSNDLLRAKVAPYFEDDPWGMMLFLYWLADQGGIDAEPPEQPDPLPLLADELLVTETFLRDIVGLLEDKGQVIFFGPPGTGKTYIARKLAEMLAEGEPSRWMVVQFHPSTSYEDFFEGFRPEEADGGQLTYRLTPGPLAVLAERAAANPTHQFLLVIDEINRANLPKVFGELLYLLEYRGEEVRTLYRGDEPFVLPRNVKIIGTMNTVDRSIALVDAALRRRFHFVPFFPNDGEMAGLLGRWFDTHHQEGRWVADLVDEVNSLLAKKLGGNDLQIGPSYFMDTRLDEDGLRRVWRYSIEPLIADVLFGRPRDIAEFEFAKVLAAFGPKKTAEVADDAAGAAIADVDGDTGEP